MRRRAPYLVTFCAFVFIGATSSASAKTETIKISRRYPFAVCTGLCPSYDLQVHADGRVELRRLQFDEADEYKQFRVSAGTAARFMRVVEKLRPVNSGDVEETNCGAHDSADMAALRIDVKELRIVWIDEDISQRLEGCDTTERDEMLTDALRVIDLFSDASKAEKNRP